jgi:hypothetical protein
MRHVLLTCKNHPNLRWGCKEIAFTDEGGYNGERNIFFWGEPSGKGLHHDGSGIDCDIYFPDREDPIIRECQCPASDLIRAPEDSSIKSITVGVKNND